jgi:predicted SnoaL-like aldol condensation-catalyzing enzyme
MPDEHAETITEGREMPHEESMSMGAPHEESMSMGDLERNKVTAEAFNDLSFNRGRPAEAVERYVGATYIQHNPLVGDGTQPFIDYFERIAAEYPGKRLEVKREFAEGDYVVMHSRQVWPGDEEYAGVDIFRFDRDGKIVEHWDVLQQVPPTSQNQNTMF